MLAAAYVAAIASTGAAYWADGMANANKPAETLILGPEDKDKVVLRLMAAGANLDRVIVAENDVCSHYPMIVQDCRTLWSRCSHGQESGISLERTSRRSPRSQHEKSTDK